jgi:hypothetical protein
MMHRTAGCQTWSPPAPYTSANELPDVVSGTGPSNLDRRKIIGRERRTVISCRRLREFWDQHDDAKEPLIRWFKLAVKQIEALARFFKVKAAVFLDG